MKPDWFTGGDYQIDLSSSISTGISYQLWLVYEDYFVEGEAIKPTGNPKVYFPMAESRLPFELAKIPPNDESAALTFVRTWGLLGRNPPNAKLPPYSENTLPFLWGHAMTVRNVLALMEALETGFPRALERAVDSIVRELPLPDSTIRELPISLRRLAQDTYQCWPRMEGAVATVGAALKRLSTEDLALGIISESISKNLHGINPVVEKLPEDVEAISESMLYRLRFAFQCETLAQIAYWHLAMRTTRKGSIGQCPECGGFFERSHKSQLFCPPTPEEIKKTKRAQSKCGMRNRIRRQR